LFGRRRCNKTTTCNSKGLACGFGEVESGLLVRSKFLRMKKVKKAYLAKTTEKQRKFLGWVRLLIIIFLIIAAVGLFCGLVAGIALHLKTNDCQELNAAWIPCGPNGDCTDPSDDNNNCGTCGHVCPEAALCVNGTCDLCVFNCSTDGDPCSIEPCNSTTGCSIFNCNTDGDPCTVGTCQTGVGCPNNCPTLFLDPPAQNFGAPTYPDAKTARFIGASDLTVSSTLNIEKVTISVSTPSGNPVISCSVPYSNITGSYSSSHSTSVYTLKGVDTPVNYQTTLRTCTYENNNQTIPSAVTFFWIATNTYIQQQVASTSTLTFVSFG